MSRPNPDFYIVVVSGCIVAAGMLAAAFAGVRWLARKFAAGPGPDSRLERLLRDIDAENQGVS